jgi:hypothetical protein
MFARSVRAGERIELFVGQRDSLVMVGMFSGRGTALDQFRCGSRLIFASRGPKSRRVHLRKYLADRRLGRDDDDNPSRSSVASMTPATIFHAAKTSTPMTTSIHAIS